MAQQDENMIGLHVQVEVVLENYKQHQFFCILHIFFLSQVNELLNSKLKYMAIYILYTFLGLPFVSIRTFYISNTSFYFSSIFTETTSQ